MIATATTTVLLGDPKGLHCTPAGRLTQITSRFVSKITMRVVETGKTADAKSVLHLMLSGARGGEHLEFTAEGPDAAEAIEEISRSDHWDKERSPDSWSNTSVPRFLPPVRMRRTVPCYGGPRPRH